MNEQHLQDVIRQGGLKVTPQRLVLLREIMAYGHLGVDDLFSRAQTHFPSISLATIYKNLHTLSDNGILREIPLPGQRSVYELAHEEHIHYVCMNCGTVHDLPADMEAIARAVREQTGADFQSIRITVGGACPDGCPDHSDFAHHGTAHTETSPVV